MKNRIFLFFNLYILFQNLVIIKLYFWSISFYQITNSYEKAYKNEPMCKKVVEKIEEENKDDFSSRFNKEGDHKHIVGKIRRAKTKLKKMETKKMEKIEKKILTKK